MISGVHHVAVQCLDLARCETFYRDVLGLAVLRRWQDETGAERSVWLSLGEGQAFLALERANEAGPAAPFHDGRAGLHLVALRIAPADRERWEARLAAAGVAVFHRTRWTLYLRDPEGNRVGLSHHPD
jgi:catechol 2,3-dioxygenase-like lactoylglutathione lyase family enzyme